MTKTGYQLGYIDAITDFRALIKEEYEGPTDIILKGFVGSLMKKLAVLEESCNTSVMPTALSADPVPSPPEKLNRPGEIGDPRDYSRPVPDYVPASDEIEDIGYEASDFS